MGTLLGSVFVAMGISLSLPAVALTAGPDAGVWSLRHQAVQLAAVAALAIALLAGHAADLEAFIVRALLLAVIGLAVVGVFAGALKQVVSGPLVLGLAISRLVQVPLGRNDNDRRHSHRPEPRPAALALGAASIARSSPVHAERPR